MDFTSGEIRGFVDAVRGKPEGGECVVQGTVTRVDADGTAWVQIGQNAEPTPCQRDMACHVGDTVTVRIADHKATITGNASAPATDDHAAKVAHVAAMTAQTSAEVAQNDAQCAQRTANTAATNARAAETAAQEAKQAAEAVNQHFWNDTRGAHVTEAEKDDYLDEPSGFQNLMTSIGNIFTKAVNGVERILRSDTASGMVVYDGECTPDAQDLEDHAVASFTSNGATIGRESSIHTHVGADNMSIMYGTDRLVSVSSDGTKASVYMGASDAAPGCKYRDLQVERFLEMFRLGYTIVFEPDEHGRCPILSPDGQATQYTAVQSSLEDIYHALDADGDEFESGSYAGISFYTFAIEAPPWQLDRKLDPQAEVPGPVDIEGGDVSVHAEDGVATCTGSIAVTDDITAQGDVADGIGTLDQVRQDSKNASNITSGTLPIARGGTGATTASDAVNALTGRKWDYNTNNTTDTWVPVSATVNGEARWQHRVIPTRLTTEEQKSFTFYTSTTSANATGWLWRRGGMVGFNVQGLYIKSSSSRVTIGQIPAGWRPPAIFFGITGNSKKVGIEANGNIWVDPDVATGQQQWISATWPLA